MFKFIDKSNHKEKAAKINNFLDDFVPYCQEKLNFDKKFVVVLISDLENSKNDLGKTAEYQPDKKIIRVFVDGRHPKDIMRSISHEIVHHTQNCRGDLVTTKETNVGYAQNDKNLRKMEKEAYLKGNMIFRDWEDNKKQDNLKEWSNIQQKILVNKLEKRFGITMDFTAMRNSKSKEVIND